MSNQSDSQTAVPRSERKPLRKLSKATSEPAPSLESLLARAAALFAGSPSRLKFHFTLGLKGGVWQFEILNHWPLWFDRDLKYEFRDADPVVAVQSFLDYVAKSCVNVVELSLPD